MFDFLNLDFLAVVNLFISVLVYAYFSRSYSNARHPSLAKTLNYFQRSWIYMALKNEVRVADIQMVGIYERNCVFLASSCLLIIASSLAMFWNYHDVVKLGNSIADSLYLSSSLSEKLLFIKLLIIFGVLTYGFFSFTWAIRQFNMFALVIISMPVIKMEDSKNKLNDFVDNCSMLLFRASAAYNNGFRSLYFTLALLSWLISPVLLIASTYVVVIVLFRREFHSRALHCLINAKIDNLI